jgi:hypothetical protein
MHVSPFEGTQTRVPWDVWYDTRMRISHAFCALLLCGAAGARAADVEPLITRPVTLPRGAVDLTLHGTYTNWSTGGTLEGGTLAAGVDFGATNSTQFGFAAAFPISPGAGFGSLLGSAAFAANNNSAFRIDAGYESIGFSAGPGRINRFFGGLGGRFRVPITPTVAFVTGRIGAVQFGHFNNLGTGGVGLYLGASSFSEAAADFLVFSGGDNGSSTNLGINLPAGLLLQPDPHLALTLQAGYSTVIESNSGSTISLHYIPLALEAVVSPVPPLDVGFRFFLDGLFTETGGTGAVPGYFDTRALFFWLRIRA